MNSSDLSLEFLKKCQKCRESGVNGEMAILAALHDLADYKDQHPRKGLWDAEKVCKVLKDYMFKERFFDNRITRTAIIDNVVCNLIKAMED